MSEPDISPHDLEHSHNPPPAAQMSDTPRTDMAASFSVTGSTVSAHFTRQLERELAELQSRLDFLKSKGLTVGMMQSSDKPEPYLAYHIEPDSELCDLRYIHRVVKLECEIESLHETIRLGREADIRGIKLWQEAGEGRELTWPDKGKLVAWLLEQLDELKKANEWQPIETAPKDGRFIQTWSKVDGWTSRVFWSSNRGGCYCDHYMNIVFPTHWKPLPKGPTE